jgi:hypothetical protein
LDEDSCRFERLNDEARAAFWKPGYPCRTPDESDGLRVGKLSLAVAEAIRTLVADLVTGDFAALEADGRIGRLSRDELTDAIAAYGRTLVPKLNLETVEVYAADRDASRFAIDIPLWTREEGRSDLTLSLTVTDSGGTVSVEIDDLHVL